MSPAISSGSYRNLLDQLWRIQGEQLVVPGSRRNVNGNVRVQSPETRPLWFTGLRRLPTQLAWLNPPEASAFDLVLSAPLAANIHTRTRERRNAADRFVVFHQLEELQFCPGVPIDWTITPYGRPEDAIGGRFWILDERRLERLEEAEMAVARVDDLELRAIAQALTSAEFSLFDEAVNILYALIELLPLRGRVALAHRACITVFKQMQDSMPTETNGHACGWVRERLDSHHEALLRCLPLAGRRDWQGSVLSQASRRNVPVPVAA